MNKQILKEFEKILNTGSSGDLDAFGCAEYNPELVGRLAKRIDEYALSVIGEDEEEIEEALIEEIYQKNEGNIYKDEILTTEQNKNNERNQLRKEQRENLK